MTPQEEVSHLVDLPIELAVELDRKPMTVRSILELEPGSVLRFTRAAGKNVDILAHGAHIGFGGIVVMEDSLGIRITDFNIEE